MLTLASLSQPTAPSWFGQLSLSLFLLVAVAATDFARAQAPPPSAAKFDTVRMEEVEPKQEFVGTVRPSRRSVIGTAVDGRVVEYAVDAGDRVEAGDTLARLRTGTIAIEIRSAAAERDLRKAELAELENGSRPEEIARAEAQLLAARALETYAKARLNRATELSQSGGAISTEELDLVLSDYRGAEQRRLEAEQSLKLLRDGPRPEQIAQAAARLAAQTERLNLLEDRQKKYDIKTPFSGFVVREATEEGAWVKQGDPIAELVDLNPVEIEVQVPERIVPHLKVGTISNVRLDAFPDKSFSGEVSNIIPDANERTRTFPVKILVENPAEDPQWLIRSGMLARVELPSSPRIKALTVHKDALVFGGAQPVVFVNDSGIAKRVPVEILVDSGERTAVRGDLREGDQVVIRGNERLRPGQELAPSKP